MKIGSSLSSAALVVLGALAASSATATEPPSKSALSPAAAASGREFRPEEFGTTGATWVRVGAEEFTPNCSAATDITFWAPDLAAYTNQRFVTGTCGFIISTWDARLLAPVRVPGGVRVDTIVLDSCDNDSSGNDVTLDVYDCDYKGSCNSTPIASLSSASNTFNCDFTSVGNLNYTMNNVNRHLLLDVRTESPNGQTTLTGVLVGYYRQISPAPVSATFGDVPTNYIYFRAIEALAASGITGGCGAGNFCPTGNVTRGEMAAFLARALGLYWANY